MSRLSFISDFWQHRCHRLSERLEEDSSLKALNQNFWLSFKEEMRKITIPNETGDQLRINVLSVQQGPTRQYAFYDWQHIPDTFRQVQRLRAAHASLRCALAGSEADKVIGAVSVNLQELHISQVHYLCEEIAKWWDQKEGVFLSPFSQMAYVMRNWLEGVYGDKPIVSHPSLDPIMDIRVDHRMLVAECANSLFSVLKKELELGESPSVGVIGEGAWAESVTSELRCLGARCDHYAHLRQAREKEILCLLLAENSLQPGVAEQITCQALIELLPGQINPNCDDVLSERGVLVVPDVVCACAQEIIEDWWIGGRRVPDWPMALYLRLSEIWADVQSRYGNENLCHHDAALSLALNRLSKSWGI